MTETVSFNGETYAVLIKSNEVKAGTEWFGEPSFPLQASRMSYGAGKTFRAHKHLINPRIIKRTQEAFVVFKGTLLIELFAEDKEKICALNVTSGDVILIYKGYHKITVLNDCLAFEIKAGQFDGYLSEEKEDL